MKILSLPGNAIKHTCGQLFPGLSPIMTFLCESFLATKELIILDPANAKNEIAAADILNRQTLILRDSYKLHSASDLIRINQKTSSGEMEYLKNKR